MRWRSARTIDNLVLGTFNTQIPRTFERSYASAPSLEQVLAETHVVNPLVRPMWPLRKGEYRFILATVFGRMRLRIRVYPAARPDAPLLLYHHGICVVPYYALGRPLIRPRTAFDAHIVMLQAPFHRWWFDPLRNGLATVHHAYQMLIGSVRMMQMVHDFYQQVGSEYTVVTGVSLGGIISFLFQSLFDEPARAIVPLIASPNMAQVFWDAAQLVKRPLSLSRQQMTDLFDFTPYFEQCDGACFHPLLASDDQFFTVASHLPILQHTHVKVLPASHVTFARKIPLIRQHLLTVLEQCKQQ